MHWNVMQASTIANRFTEILSKANLLALTASVEAARADNDGRRFDLLSREVKLLAKRTAKANSEIAGQTAGSGPRPNSRSALSSRSAICIDRISQVLSLGAVVIEAQGRGNQALRRMRIMHETFGARAGGTRTHPRRAHGCGCASPKPAIVQKSKSRIVSQVSS
ncbi:methyl-accepting chemotaxis protein [Bradyrhizobium yuanmingense]|uniref:methyl-accepting chemotaxis protein n=1 Tax=Bradyrhizobium yuanmingense TaxID=108015 RepID=UPI0023B97664|nr:methyl-accepting chemotaxis protein [Bradyrhizobium yuanmingense]MDF0492941.1 methyl-accepting chemotaxis protein [Bradyrhizobium yuanmingense]